MTDELTPAERIAEVLAKVGLTQEDIHARAEAPKRAPEEEPTATPAQYLRGCGFGRRDADTTWDAVPADIRGGLQFYCEQLAWHLERGYGLSLTGQYGAGKTCGLALIALAAQALGLEPWQQVWYVRTGDLTAALDTFAEQRTERMGDNLWAADHAKLLLLDDLGSERESTKAAGDLFAIFEGRRSRRYATCTASNLSLESLMKERPWHGRMVDRLLSDNPELITKAQTQRQRATPGGRHSEWEASQ